ncbi:hypothetical protein bsdcttw_41390 [Anaerocolumna chitinilytica]|uniref:Uncharacterized protein n=1 Tax=Anaerocolumna chitinilytica TaxID=1727145 RepID=A0A7I8DRR2_9FIRM|nr:hypothetical protein bsdcttw_41390 [Anaerocolumna chitinilytica]
MWDRVIFLSIRSVIRLAKVKKGTKLMEKDSAWKRLSVLARKSQYVRKTA